MKNFLSLSFSTLFLFFALLLCVLPGCAPGLGSSLSLDEISAPLSTEASLESPLRLRVGNFVDRRESREIVKIDGREVNPGSNVEEVVRNLVEAELRGGNVDEASLAVPRLTGEILSWKAEVEPGFPMSELKSEASLRLLIWGAGDRVVFSSTYSGEVSQKHPFPTESTIRGMLGEALSLAVVEAIKDERFRTETRNAGGV